MPKALNLQFFNKVNAFRPQLAILAIIMCGLSFNGYVLIENIRFPKEKIIIGNTSEYLERFLTLRQVLPKRGVVGYISDDTTDEGISTPRKYLAQYSLAPVILARSLDRSLVVGNFRNRPSDLELYRKMGLIPLRDFGNGVVLFTREFK